MIFAACKHSVGLIQVSGANLLSKYVGESQINICLCFEMLKKQQAGTILFFDEIDGMVTKRDDDNASGSNGMIQMFLQELTNFKSSDQGFHFVVAATNRYV